MPFGRRTRCGLAKETAYKYANTHHNDVVPSEDEDVDVAHVTQLVCDGGNGETCKLTSPSRQNRAASWSGNFE